MQTGATSTGFRPGSAGAGRLARYEWVATIAALEWLLLVEGSKQLSVSQIVSEVVKKSIFMYSEVVAA